MTGPNTTPFQRRITRVATLAARPLVTNPNLQLGDRVQVAADGSTWELTQVGALPAGRAWALLPLVSRIMSADGSGNLDGAGQLAVPDIALAATDRIVMVFQGVGGTGALRLAVFTPGVGFTLQSSTGAADAAAAVYWQVWSIPAFLP